MTNKLVSLLPACLFTLISRLIQHCSTAGIGTFWKKKPNGFNISLQRSRGNANIFRRCGALSRRQICDVVLSEPCRMTVTLTNIIQRIQKTGTSCRVFWDLVYSSSPGSPFSIAEIAQAPPSLFSKALLSSILFSGRGDDEKTGHNVNNMVTLH
ncbi:hypothetical protein HD554DRAFT_2097898 [Boletus coccyginus]|nr:hypothetical protein HD554DRAFT_2097898 [Boletus coccyginus]